MRLSLGAPHHELGLSWLPIDHLHELTGLDLFGKGEVLEHGLGNVIALQDDKLELGVGWALDARAEWCWGAASWIGRRLVCMSGQPPPGSGLPGS